MDRWLRKGSRIIRATYRIECGTKRLAQLGLKISTTLLGRLNLTLRQSLAPLARKTLGFSKERKNLRKQIVFFQAFYNFARPYMSLQEKVSETTKPFEQRWASKTPGMAAGLTDHVWTFRELLTIKLAQAP